MKKVLFLHTNQSKNIKIFLDNKKINEQLQIHFVNFSDITEIKQGVLLMKDGSSSSIDSIDKIWFDFDWNIDNPEINYYHISKIIIDNYYDKFLVNGSALKRFHPIIEDKLFMFTILNNYGIPSPKSTPLSTLSEVSSPYSYPLVIKKRLSARGRHVYLLKKYEELPKEIACRPYEYIVQELINIKSEYRVVVYKNRIIGNLKKDSMFKDGGTNKVVMTKDSGVLPEGLKEICRDTARLLDLDLVGIDAAEDYDGNYYIIEFNCSLALRKFTKYTGSNIFEEIFIN